MNETTFSDGIAGASPADNLLRTRAPDTSLLPGSEKAPPPAVTLLDRAMQGAHHALDTLSDRAKPVAWKVSDQVSATQHALQDKAAHLRQTGDEWTENLRDTVRSQPLMALLAAAALGLFVARITHRR